MSGCAANATEPNAELQLLKWISYAYISPVIVGVGIIGDLMTIFILSQPLLRHSGVIYQYLSFLAITDLCTQLSVVPMILWLLDIKLCGHLAALYYAHVGFPLANAFMGASVWIVVFLTMGQYVAVCHPFSDRLRSRRTCYYLTALSYLLCFVIYIPWGTKKSVRGAGSSCAYIACDNEAILASRWFQMYQWVREVISRFVPFALITFFNVRILCSYRATRADRLARICQQQQRSVVEKTEREQRRLWTLLLGIMLVFFVCTIPAAPLTIVVSDDWATHLPFQIARSVINILEFTKFALNFYFYCMINPDIRRLCLHKLLCRQLERPALVGARSTTLLSNYTTKRTLGHRSLSHNPGGSARNLAPRSVEERDALPVLCVSAPQPPRSRSCVVPSLARIDDIVPETISIDNEAVI